MRVAYVIARNLTAFSASKELHLSGHTVVVYFSVQVGFDDAHNNSFIMLHHHFIISPIKSINKTMSDRFPHSFSPPPRLSRNNSSIQQSHILEHLDCLLADSS